MYPVEWSVQIADAWPNIILAFAALGVAAASPGPTATAIMGASMGQGRRAGLVLTAGAMTGSLGWACLAGLGLSAWLTSFSGGAFILKTIGGLYLLWMAGKALRAALTPGSKAMASRVSGTGRALYLKGLALHMTNPKAILGWAAVITLSQTDGGSLPVLLFTLAGCMCITITIHVTYAIAFASKPAMKAYAKARRSIEGVLSGMFGFAGYKLLTA